MKKIGIIACMTCALMTTSCVTDDTLEDTRVMDVEIPAISLNDVTVAKYDATFNITLNTSGNPAVREYGVMISQEAEPTTENSTIMTADKAESTASIKATFNPGTTYYVCAYALTANRLVTSDVKSFTTDSHPLGAFIGKKTLTGESYYEETLNSIQVTLLSDENDESVLYLSGLASEAGVSLVLERVKLVFDLDNNTVVIPDGQIVQESNYGAYRYVGLNAQGAPVTGDIVGRIENGAIHFDGLAALIVQGGNSGLPHWLYYDITVQ